MCILCGFLLLDIVYKLFLCFVGRGLLVAEAAWSIAQDTTESQVDILSCTEIIKHQVGLNISLYDTDFKEHLLHKLGLLLIQILYYMYINSISAISNYCAEFLDKLSGHVKS